MERVVQRQPNVTGDLGREILTFSSPLEDAADLDPLLERIGDARYVLLGEASHGTHEYYIWRARLSRRLIEEKGFRFIAVEGDWPDCYRVNRYVQGELGDATARGGAARLRPLADLDVGQLGGRRAGRVAASITTTAGPRPSGSASTDSTSTACGSRSTRSSATSSSTTPTPSRPPAGPSAASSPTARTRRNTPAPRCSCRTPARTRCSPCCGLCRERAAEDAGRTRPASTPSRTRWSSRTPRPTTGRWFAGGAAIVEPPRPPHGRDARPADAALRTRRKAIVWEHNTHIGDARYTDMANDGMVNVGQLVRRGAWRRRGRAGRLRLLLRGRVIAGRSGTRRWRWMPVRRPTILGQDPAIILRKVGWSPRPLFPFPLS